MVVSATVAAVGANEPKRAGAAAEAASSPSVAVLRAARDDAVLQGIAAQAGRAQNAPRSLFHFSSSLERVVWRATTPRSVTENQLSRSVDS
jgi:hypothetical protein